MAIKYTGYAENDTFTVGSNQAAIVDGGSGIDTIKITADQTQNVNTDLDATATIALQAGVSIASATTLFGSQIVTLTNGAVITADAGATFTIGTQTVTMAELSALGAGYAVTGNEAPANTAAPVMTDADSAITLTANTAAAMDSAVTVADAEGDFTAATLAFSDVGNAGTYALNGTTVYADTTNNYVIALDANSDEQVIGTVSGAGTSDMTITLNSSVNTGIVETLIEGTTYTAADTGDQTLTVTLTDAAGNVMTHDYDTSVLAETTLALSALNNDLVVVARTDTATVNVDLGTNATVNLDDGNTAAGTLDVEDMVGGTLTIALSGTTDAADQLSFLAATTTSAGFRMMGDVIVYDADADGTTTNAAGNEQVIGTLSGTGTVASPFEITFATGVVDADIENLLQNLEFDTTDTAAIGERTVTVTLTDAAGTNVATASTSMFVVNSFMTLTTANDTGATFVGTADTDAYQAANDALDSGDVLDGGDGTDFLLAELTETSVAPNISGVEQFRLSANDADGTNEMSFANVTHATEGAATISVDGIKNVALTNIGASVGTIDLSNAGAADTNTTSTTVVAANAALDYTGSNGVDTIVMATTLNNEDSIDGGSDTIVAADAGEADVLSATINGLDATTGLLDITNVEQIDLITATASSIIDASGIIGDGTNGIEIDLKATSATGIDLTLTNVNETVTMITNSDNDADIEVTFAADADVTLSGGAGGNIVANMGTTLDGADIMTTAGGSADVVNATFDGATDTNNALTIAATGLAFVAGTTVVTGTSTAHGMVVGDVITFGTVTAANALGAATLGGNQFVIATVADANTFTIANTINGGTSENSATVAASTFVDTSADANTALNLDNVETLNITSSTNASTLEFIKTIVDATNISGDADLTINNIESATNVTFNAATDATSTGSTMTGDITLDVNAAANHSITGGLGDDTFNFSSTATINASDAIDGGTGADAVTATLNTTAGAINIDNVETITLNVDTATTVELTDVDGDGTTAVTLNLNAAVTATGTDTVTTLRVNNTITTIDASGLDSTADDLTLGQNAIVLGKGDTDGEDAGATGDDSIAFTVADKADGSGYATITVSNDAAGATFAIGDVIDFAGITLSGVDDTPDTTNETPLGVLLNAGTYVLTAVNAASADTTPADNISDGTITFEALLDADNNGVFDIADDTYYDETEDANEDGAVTVYANAFGAAGMTVEASAGANVITAGTGNDTFNFNETTFDAADIINGLTGTDTLTAQITTDITPEIANVENITLNTTADLNLTTSGITHNTAGAVSLTIAGGNKVVFTDMSAAIGSVDTSGASAAGLDITFDNSAARDFTVSLGAGQSDLFRLDLGANAEDAGIVTISGFEAGDDLLDFRGAVGDGVAADSIDGLGDLIRTNVDLLDAAGNQVGSAAYTVADGVNDSVKITADGNYANVDFEINVVGVTSAEIVDSLVF